MTSGFNGATLFASSNNSFSRQFTFSRQSHDTTDYTGAAISVRFYDKQGDDTPLLTLSVGSGLSISTDSAASQVVRLDLSSANLTTLRAGKNTNVVFYNWTIQPIGGQRINAPRGDGYDGSITVVLESYAGQTKR